MAIADLALKAFMRSYLAENSQQTLIPGVLDLTLVFNKGAAFGMGQGMQWLFAVFAAGMVIAGFVYIYKQKTGIATSLVLGLIAGGALGNLYDRVVFGAVTDYLKTTFITFPVFNFADICVVCGTIIFIIGMFAGTGSRDNSDPESSLEQTVRDNEEVRI
ncbi:MAG: signal peptidase II [Coriobacteriales bacterium]|nr:signal peptidase II [Coriobacteriales bacterium]